MPRSRSGVALIRALPIVALSLLFIPLASPGFAAVVAGTVIDPDGRPAPDVRVVLSTSLHAPDAVTDPQGRFRFERLDPGTYDVHALRRGFRVDPLRLTVEKDGTYDLTLRLRLSAVSESIVVTAASVDTSLSRMAAPVTVLTRQDLEIRQIETLADALRLVPGFGVVRTGGRGSITAVFPRGGESDSTLVLVDGVRANDFGGGFDFAKLPVGDIERIEVVRGPQSALYGSDAIGAVVQVFTRHGGPTRLDGTLEVGSFDTTRASLVAAGSAGPMSWGAAAERLDTSGYDGIAPATGEHVVNDDHRLTNVSLSGGWQGDETTRIRGNVRLTSSERGFPGPFGSDPGGNITAIDRISRGTNDSLFVSFGATHGWTDRLRQRLDVTASDLDGDFVSPFGRSVSETRRLSARLQNDLTVTSDLGISAGVEVQGERAASTFITGASAAPVPVRRRVIGLFGEARLTPGIRTVVTAGLRVEHIRRSALEPDPNGFEPRPPFAGSSIVSANPKFSLSYLLSPPEPGRPTWTRVRLNAGTGIRPPDAFEIAFTDNPALKPERSRSIDVGLEQAFGGGAVIVEATGFYNHYDDLIVAVGRSFADASRFRTDNISNARTRGVELQTSLRTSWGLDARLGYTWLDTDVLAVDGASGVAPAPFAVGDSLLRRPRHHGTLDLVLARGPLTLHGLVGSRGEILDVEPTFGSFGGVFRSAGYTTVDLGAQLRVHRRAELFVRVTNAFDRAYEEALGFPALGRSFVSGFRFATGR